MLRREFLQYVAAAPALPLTGNAKRVADQAEDPFDPANGESFDRYFPPDEQKALGDVVMRATFAGWRHIGLWSAPRDKGGPRPPSLRDLIGVNPNKGMFEYLPEWIVDPKKG